VLEAGQEILERLGQKESRQLTLEQIRRLKAEVEATAVSEAGVVLPAAAAEAEIREFISDVIATVGGAAHPGGGEGVDSTHLAAFLEQAHAFLQWRGHGQVPKGKKKTDIMPLGAKTPEAYRLFSALRGKIDQYFAQCVAVTLDERFAQRMGWLDSELEGLDFDDPAVIERVLRKAPLAKATPEQTLDFDSKLNPYYVGTLEEFRRKVVAPVLGKSEPKLTPDDWDRIKSFFAAHDNWVRSKAGACVEPLGEAKLRKYLDRRFADAVEALIAESKHTASVLEKVRLLEKVILFQVHLIDFANNFVGFRNLYDPADRAMFEMGSLVMDGRRFNFAVRTGDYLQHKAVAGTSNMYVLYVEVAGNSTDPALTLAVPVTSGGKGNLCVGKRGLFYDVRGNEFDARVIDIIENPISFREALLSPFQRLGRLLVGKIESITTAAEKKLDAQTTKALDQITTQPQTTQAAEAQPSRVSRAGLLMGAGVTIAALGSALAYITKTLAQVRPAAVVAGVVIAVLAVMLPISIVALLKLRRRDLSAILEGSGWAINARMRLTRRQSQSFTERPVYPEGSKGIRSWPPVGFS